MAAMVLIISASTKRAIAAKSVKERKPAKSVLDDLAVFASRFNIAPLDAYVPPGLFGSAAAKAGLALQMLVAEANFRSKTFSEHLANAARMVAAEDRNGV